jgi:hypothetical protein
MYQGQLFQVLTTEVTFDGAFEVLGMRFPFQCLSDAFHGLCYQFCYQ